MAYWTTIQILRQVTGELGLNRPTTVVGTTDVTTIQMLSLLNAAGNELALYYPWEQLVVIQELTLLQGVDEYDVPADLNYYRDQTQWDAVNHWPLLGPKSAQEWAWLKNSFVASLPRMRFRIKNNKLCFFPSPPEDGEAYMEYISKYWIAADSDASPTLDISSTDDEVIWFNEWLMVKFIKLKFYELKGFATGPVKSDFLRVFESLTGKDTGAEKLNLAPTVQYPYVGPWSVPDGSWNV